MPSLTRRAGDEYQDVYGWFRALELLRPARKVAVVSIEDTTAGFFDDVTLRPEPGTSHAAEFVQVKFHMSEAGSYSAEALLTKRTRNERRTLLQKAWVTWKALRFDNPGLELLLVSTWSWDHRDPIATHLRRGSRLEAEFVEGRCDKEAMAARTRWHEHLESPPAEEFEAFLRSLRFRVGYPATEELMAWTAERMELVGLKHEEKDIFAAAHQIMVWIAEGKETITKPDMLDAIERLQLKDPEAPPLVPSVSLYVHTIRKEPLEVDGDYELDWRDHFEGEEWLRGHAVHDPAVWNEVMLPELIGVRERAATDSSARLLRARGLARLSAWFAIGYVFSPLAGYTIEVDQNGERWSNDAAPSDDLVLVEQPLEPRGGDPETLAVGVSLTGDLGGDVRQALADAGEPAGNLLLVTTNRGLGRTIQGPGDLTALADQLQAQMRSVLGHRPAKVLLFYFGPLAGAAFIGARLNAVAKTVQVYEDQNPGYAPSFTLTFA
jgi:hypothetical protein